MKRVVLFLLVVFCALSLKAQKVDFKPELYVGAGGGPLFSTVDFVPSLAQKSRMGYHGGVSAKYISEKHLGLLLEVNLAKRGWQEDYPNNPEFAYTRNLTYLEVPFMTHIYFGKKARFILNVGPQLSFLLSSSSDLSKPLADFVAGQEKQKPSQYARYGDADRKFDYGLIGGLGMELKTGIGDIDIEGRYYFGLGDVFYTRSKGNGYYTRSAHRLIEAKLTYYIKIF